MNENMLVENTIATIIGNIFSEVFKSIYIKPRRELIRTKNELKLRIEKYETLCIQLKKHSFNESDELYFLEEKFINDLKTDKIISEIFNIIKNQAPIKSWLEILKLQKQAEEIQKELDNDNIEQDMLDILIRLKKEETRQKMILNPVMSLLMEWGKIDYSGSKDAIQKMLKLEKEMIIKLEPEDRLEMLKPIKEILKIQKPVEKEQELAEIIQVNRGTDDICLKMNILQENILNELKSDEIRSETQNDFLSILNEPKPDEAKLEIQKIKIELKKKEVMSKIQKIHDILRLNIEKIKIDYDILKIEMDMQKTAEEIKEFCNSRINGILNNRTLVRNNSKYDTLIFYSYLISEFQNKIVYFKTKNLFDSFNKICEIIKMFN